MTGFLKKFSDFLGLSDPESMKKAPPLDGEIIYCKNNVCVHPPSNLQSNNVEHYPGYLTMRAQGNGNVQSSLLLTWIPNSSLNKSPSRRRGVGSPSSSCSSPCFEKDRRGGGGHSFKEDQSDDSVSRDTAFSQECSTPAVAASVERESPVGSLQSFQDSGIGEGDKSKVSADSDDVTAVERSNSNGHMQQQEEPVSGYEDKDETSNVTNHTCESSEIGTDATNTDNTQIDNEHGGTESSQCSDNNIQVDIGDAESKTNQSSKLETDLEVTCNTQVSIEQAESDNTHLISSSSSPNAGAADASSISLPSPVHSNSGLEQMRNDSRSPSELSKSSISDELSTDAQLAALIAKDNGHDGDAENGTKKKTDSLERPSALHGLSDSADMDSPGETSNLPGNGSNRALPHSSSSSTSPTTSNPDLRSLPSTPSDDDESSFDPFVHLYNQGTPSPDPVVSPVATYNMTFPENSVVYTSPGGRKSPRPTVKEQLCGVFSVDLSEMRSLRLFFSNPSCTSGQLVIASQESQYKILHFHHGGLDRLAEVFEEWRYCIQQNSKKVASDDDTKQLYRKFTIIQSSLKPAECHPEEGIYGEVDEEMLWSYMNEKGQIEDDYQLRKAIFFGGIDEYLRCEVWPFLLHYYGYDSTTDERNSLRGQKREEYKAIHQMRLAMGQTEYEEFWKNVQCTVDKDVVRTDRSHPYFKGNNNPHLDMMRNILLNYAVYNPNMGYSQGMSDLLAPLLAELQDESNAFWCFVGLMQSVLFVSSPKDEDMEEQLGYLKNLLKHMLPEFWTHLESLGDAMDLLFCHRWILLCFKREFHEPEALRMWESCWAHYQTDYFHLFICLAIIAIYGEDVVHQKLASDDMLLHFSNLSMQMDGTMVLKKARSLLHKFRTLPRIPCTLDKLCERCAPGMWDSGHTPEVECVGFHEEGFACPHIR